MKEPVIALNGWHTIKHYAESKGISTQVVTNWIARDRTDKIRYRRFPELNNLVLVKDAA